jgi:hypothetical protein
MNFFIDVLLFGLHLCTFVQKEKAMTPCPFAAPNLSFQTNFIFKGRKVGLALKEQERRSCCWVWGIKSQNEPVSPSSMRAL